MIPALRWAAMRAILMFHNCEGQSHKTVSTDHSFWRERRAEADSNRGPSVYQPNALPLGQTGSQYLIITVVIFYSAVSHWQKVRTLLHKQNQQRCIHKAYKNSIHYKHNIICLIHYTHWHTHAHGGRRGGVKEKKTEFETNQSSWYHL